MARRPRPSHSSRQNFRQNFHQRSPSDSYPYRSAAAFRPVALLLVLLPHSLLSAAFPLNHSTSGITGVNWLINRPQFSDAREWSHVSHVSRGSHGANDQPRISLLEAAPSRETPPLLADSQLRALLDLNAAWHLWPTNSNRSRRCDQWDHVQCSRQGFVTALDLTDLAINATMPLTLFSNMPYLRRLVLASNILSGSITALSLPPSLRVLDLSRTEVSGSLPSTILSLSALAHLDISRTSIAGSLPSTLARLSRLTYLNIGAENITGRVEDLSWLSSLTNLHTLEMDFMLGVNGDLSALTFLTALKAMQSLTISNVVWTGELPALLGSLTSLTYLDLSGISTSQFPRWVMELTALQYLNVVHRRDYRSGVVPQDLSRLSKLQYFDASGNGLVGALPEYWTSLNHLTYLSLSQNKIEGSIPATFSALTSLITLDLQYNRMDGTIPPVFSTALCSLDVGINHFSGPIPPFLGSLTGLTRLDLSNNNFTGAIPESLTNLTGFSQLWRSVTDISFNSFSSGFPDLSSLPSLMLLAVAGNHLQGPFPTVLLKLTSLMALDIGQNELYGPIPSDLSKLSNLMRLDLSENGFYGENPLGLFSLMNLDDLILNNNRFSGRLPSTLATASLGLLNLQGNGISGPLPDFAQWNTSVQRLLLGDNNLTGTIPQSISTLTSLNIISLANNHLSGPFPTALTTLTDLEAIDVAFNSIAGSLPAGLGALVNLRTLSVSDNQLTGRLPPSICNLTALETMLLRNNYLFGSFPSCLFENCLHRIDISNNSFYGPINTNFRSMIPDNYALLNIAGNYFYGDPMLYADGCQFCPSEIVQPLVLKSGDFGRSSGGRCVPQTISRFVEVTQAGANKRGAASLRQNCFTLSAQLECTANETQRSSDACLAFCSMSRELGPCDGHGACVTPQPGAAGAGFTCECDHGYVTANGALGSTCARPSPPPPAALSTGAVVGIAVGSATTFALLLALIVALLWPKQRRRWSGLDVCREFSIGEILRATDNWAGSNMVGKGGFATVYKGVSSTGELWAVKRSKLMSNDFETEVRAMASLRHEHVVRLLGFCLHQNVESGQQEQILVYEFVGNGDLKHHIHDSKTPLSLQQRVQLAVGAAEGVAYLHSFATPIVHRDLKPGNILVGEHNQAKIADFGLLKLLSHADGGDDRTRVAGTPGYVDPDYNRTNLVSEKSDVYSFGVVLLELLTKQKPAVEGTDTHISDWAAKKVQGYELGALKDASLEAPDEAVVELADIALDCLKMPASRRPHMKDVARRLHHLLQLHCAAHSHSSLAEPSLRKEGRRPAGGEGSSRDRDTFGRSGLSGGTSVELSASRSLVHSLSEKWQMIQ
ncbi:hypothetical protein CLOM_g21598 [Closterium sp. NIES-68]|nr:hypothetical protein CLOM_g21598 [Closterium sp. NIES-68]